MEVLGRVTLFHWGLSNSSNSSSCLSGLARNKGGLTCQWCGFSLMYWIVHFATTQLPTIHSHNFIPTIFPPTAFPVQLFRPQELSFCSICTSVLPLPHSVPSIYNGFASRIENECLQDSFSICEANPYRSLNRTFISSYHWCSSIFLADVLSNLKRMRERRRR